MAKVNRTCEICSSTFLVKPSVAAIGQGKFCSRACQGISNRTNRSAELTHEALTSYLAYDATTGAFTLKVNLISGKKAGDTVGTIHKDGYVTVSVYAKNYKAHRLAWFYVHGVWPTGEIDHKDCDRGNNRIANLRDVSHQTNMQNRRVPQSNNESGFLGVTFRDGQYYPRIKIDGRTRLLPPHATGEEAYNSYLEAKRIHYPGHLD